MELLPGNGAGRSIAVTLLRPLTILRENRGTDCSTNAGHPVMTNPN